MRTRTILTILLLIAVLGGPGLVQAQDGVTLTVEEATGNPDSTAEVVVSMVNAAQVGALDLSLRYDDSVAQFAQARVGSNAENALMEANEIEDGLLLVALADSDGLSGDGPVVVIEFDVLGSEGDRTTITVETARAYDYDTLIDIPLTTTDGELTVVGRGMSLQALVGIIVGVIVLVIVLVWLFRRRRCPRPIPERS